jgi:PAS domain S-box-containing protein
MAMGGRLESQVEEVELLRTRIRLGVWLFLAATGAFALADLRLAAAAVPRLYLLKFVGFATAGVILWRLADAASRRVLVALGLVALAVAMILSTVSGVITGDLTTSPVLCLVLALTVATTLPWGVAPQLVAAMIGTLCVLGHTVLLRQPLGYTGLAGIVTVILSVYVAHALERQRVVLAHTRERHRDLLERSTDLIQSVDPHGRLLYANEAWRAALGYGEAELPAMTMRDLVHADSRAMWSDALTRALHGESVDAFTGALVARDGHAVHVLGSVTAVFAGGHPVSVRGIFRDVTAQRAIEGALRASERRFELLVQHASDVTTVVDVNGVIQYVSPSCERVFGFRPSEFVGRAAAEFIHPDDHAAAVATFTAAPEGSTARGEYRQRTADGCWVEVETTGTILNADPDVRGTVLSVRDVSERHRIEAALRDSEERFRVTFEHAAVGIAHVAPDGRWLRVNRRLCEIVGYSAEELLGGRFQDITHPDDLDADLAYVAEMLAGTRQTYSMEKRYLHRDRTAVWINLTVALVRDAAGAPRHFISVIEDISERKRSDTRIQSLNEALRARSRALAAANREMEAFSYSVSHDLRAPLRAIEGFNRMLIEDYAEALGVEGRRYLERVRAASERMEQLINDLLLLGQITRREVNRRQVDVSALAEAVAAELRERHAERHVEAVIAPGVRTHADPNLLRIVLENLLGNAWKYTARRSDGRVEFGRAAADGADVLFVRDDGAGFDMTYADRLFRPFQRLHSDDEFEGTGIGLAIVQRIVRLHGGRVWAEAAPDQGATFFFTLEDAGGDPDAAATTEPA